MNYTEHRDLPSIVSGNTLDAVIFKRTEIPAAVEARLENCAGRVVHKWDAEIGADGTVTLPRVNLRLPAGQYGYAVRFVMQNGTRRTFYNGCLTIEPAISNCKGH